VAVVGAHLTGQPLNRQLTERGARLVQSCRTSPEYRFYALANTTPPKPGLVREPGFDGPGIALEIWAVPSNHFGSFVAGVPAPLGIGSVQLDTGAWVKGFICEPAAIAGATEITEFGSWTSYLTALTAAVSTKP
jgi:allophanate hydrolase